MKLTKKLRYNGVIEVKTGLHIGGTNTQLNIGGPDKFVVRNPITKVPYIPGSSLKGKLRSLLELSLGEISKYKDDTIGACKNAKSISAKLFGIAPDSNDNESKGGHPSRLIVRDADMIVKDYILNKEDLVEDNEAKKIEVHETDFDYTDLLYTESKTEVSIDRITAKSNPRTFERVPAGTYFSFEMILNIFDEEKDIEEASEGELKNALEKAIELLEADYLGGQGSRGYGQVKFHFIEKGKEVKL